MDQGKILAETHTRSSQPKPSPPRGWGAAPQALWGCPPSGALPGRTQTSPLHPAPALNFSHARISARQAPKHRCWSSRTLLQPGDASVGPGDLGCCGMGRCLCGFGRLPPSSPWLFLAGREVQIATTWCWGWMRGCRARRGGWGGGQGDDFMARTRSSAPNPAEGARCRRWALPQVPAARPHLPHPPRRRGAALGPGGWRGLAGHPQEAGGEGVEGFWGGGEICCHLQLLLQGERCGLLFARAGCSGSTGCASSAPSPSAARLGTVLPRQPRSLAACCCCCTWGSFAKYFPLSCRSHRAGHSSPAAPLAAGLAPLFPLGVPAWFLLVPDFATTLPVALKQPRSASQGDILISSPSLSCCPARLASSWHPPLGTGTFWGTDPSRHSNLPGGAPIPQIPWMGGTSHATIPSASPRPSRASRPSVSARSPT